MLAQYLDLTEEFNNNPAYEVVIDVSNYDYCLIQPIGDNVNLFSTIDSGAVQSVTDGNATTAVNFTAVSALRLSNGTTYETQAKDEDIARLAVVGRYVKISKGSPITKLLVMLTKIS